MPPILCLGVVPKGGSPTNCLYHFLPPPFPLVVCLYLGYNGCGQLLSRRDLLEFVKPFFCLPIISEEFGDQSLVCHGQAECWTQRQIDSHAGTCKSQRPGRSTCQVIVQN